MGDSEIDIEQSLNRQFSHDMPWTDTFPVLTDQLVEEYHKKASDYDLQRIQEFFEVAKVILPPIPFDLQDPPRDGAQHIVSVSLFWKNWGALDPERSLLPSKGTVTYLHNQKLKWRALLNSFLRHQSRIKKLRRFVEFRVYLASDLAPFINDLIEAGWVVYLMKSDSIRYNPAGLWRHLALSEKNANVTILSVEQLSKMDGLLEITRQMEKAELGFWRVPGYSGCLSSSGKPLYLPISGNSFGSNCHLPVQNILEAFVWYMENKEVSSPFFGGDNNILNIDWIGPEGDELFQMIALYPRLALEGTLTLVESSLNEKLLALDIEYVTWASGHSEIVYL